MEIYWKTIGGRKCLYLKFIETLTEADANAAVNEWTNFFDSSPDSKITFVWDCLQMKDYDRKARRLWQEKLMSRKHQIDKIWVISNSVIIDIGAHVIELFTKLDIKVVKSENEIKF
jgi:hypothetical protein